MSIESSVFGKVSGLSLVFIDKELFMTYFPQGCEESGSRGHGQDWQRSQTA